MKRTFPENRIYDYNARRGRGTRISNSLSTFLTKNYSKGFSFGGYLLSRSYPLTFDDGVIYISKAILLPLYKPLEM